MTDAEMRWAADYQATLLVRLLAEADAGWRTVTDLTPQDCPQAVHVTAENVIPIRPHWESRPHLRVVS